MDKKLELVLTKTKPDERIWQLYHEDYEAVRIGNDIKIEMADFEFIGIAYFSKTGAEVLRKVYHDCKRNWKGQFHQAANFNQASFIDVIQEIINRGFKVNIVEVQRGWIEIHNPEDLKIANTMLK